MEGQEVYFYKLRFAVVNQVKVNGKKLGVKLGV